MPMEYYYAYILSRPHVYLPTLFHLRLWILISTGLVTAYPAHTICLSRIITLPQLKLLTPGVPESPSSATPSSI
jgi:hypothetical protein